MATIKSKAAHLDIEVEAGSTFDSTITWKDSANSPIDLTNYTAEMQLRSTIDSDTILDTLSTVNSRIVLGGTFGTIQIIFPHVDSSAYTFDSAVYDLELTSPLNVKRRLIEGSIIIKPEVTR